MKLEPGKFYLTYGGEIMVWAGKRPAETCYLRRYSLGHVHPHQSIGEGRCWYWAAGTEYGGRFGGCEDEAHHPYNIKKEIRP